MKERTQRMLTLYYEGYSMGEIGKIFGVSRQRVHQLIGDRGDGSHYGSRSREEHREEIRQANARVLAGESTIQEEAERLGIRPQSLRAAFHRLELELPPRPISPLHGTYYRYQSGCRCEECKAALRAYRDTMRLREPPRHGTISAYRNFACRCDECRKAASIDNRRYREMVKMRDRERMPAD